VERRDWLKRATALVAVTRFGTVPLAETGTSAGFQRASATGAIRVTGLDLKAVPWSRYGSYLALSTLVHAEAVHGESVAPGLYLHDVSGNRMWQWNGVFRIELLHDDAVVTPYVDEATPGRVRLIGGDGVIEVTWDGTNVLRFRGTGVGLRLTQAVPDSSALAFPVSTRAFRLAMGVNLHFAATVLIGEATVEGLRSRTGTVAADTKTVLDIRPGAAGTFELALESYEASWQVREYPRAFALCVADVDAEFSAWLTDTLQTPKEYANTGCVHQLVMRGGAAWCDAACRHAHVEELDAWRLELGSLLQRAGAGSRTAVTGMGPVHVTVRCAARAGCTPGPHA
jgi:hypothetical protein